MLHYAGEIEHEWRDKDPQHARERRKYAHPVPSREFLLSFLDQKAEPLTEQELATALDLGEDPALLEGLNRRLEAMLRDGQLVCNRRGAYGLPERMNLVRGLVLAHRDGFGFLRPDDGGEDVFLPPRQMRALLHGDRALVRIVEVDRRNRRVGSLLTVLERNTQQI
ncbi:MAG TPA: ribonuclease R, partial [Gammaproteobacteria bacterium]|nr:ribonuclease R [Gammaproteobacteria bacterium]